ncbi:MAG TPA: saccharopine dehydrogenase C-terminal domain-containing protein [Candidatus Thermoplasmatota archaeon]|nr:saccharopine dehydrogenase C-terminal domain-containing protein [Candidatus Thermoplasmatota archaeon]
MHRRFVVFGGGMQGRVAAADLAAEGHEVVVADVRAPAALPAGARHEAADATRRDDVARLARGADACVLALPSALARRALEHLVSVGARVADVSFTPEPPLDLDAAAKASGACALVDCGVAPGLSHVLAGAAHRELGGLDGLVILVGGLPLAPPRYFHHAVYFNPRDLVAEYLRPARLRRAGRDEAPAPLEAHVETHKDAEYGELESFVSDGLRTLLASFPDCPEMEERTLRWPGHLHFMRGLRAAGLLDEPGGTADATAAALGRSYPGEEHPDVLLMEVRAQRGAERRAWRLADVRREGLSAMARTTAFTTTAVARLLARGDFREPGVHAPERLGLAEGLAARVLAELGARGVGVERSP